MYNYTCPNCEGSGYSDPTFPITCKICEGKKYINSKDLKRLANECYKCGGQFGEKQIDYRRNDTYKQCLKCGWSHYE